MTVAWTDRARYIRVLGELRDALSREIDRVQRGDPADMVGLVELLERTDEEQARYHVRQSGLVKRDA